MKIAIAIAALVCGAAACGRAARTAGSCDGPCPASKINHLIVIVQENHTFDDHFGRYCTAPAGSNPSCTAGPACCEAAPDHDPGTGGAPSLLDDAANAAYDPNHNQDCETDELDDGKMDRFVSSTRCGSAKNFAYADATTMQPLWSLASSGALADRYFQPTTGASFSNDMYLVRARYVFQDNSFGPDSVGKSCSIAQHATSFGDATIGDLLAARGVSFAWYAEGYRALADAEKSGGCPPAPDDCRFGLGLTPCIMDPGDVPIEYFPSLRDQPATMRDYAQLAADLASGKLPQVAFVKPVGYHSEHAGLDTTLSDGVRFVTDTIAAIRRSPYAPDALIVVTYDEGGGFFDHVAPPPALTDGQPYGTRVPTLALGPFARANAISHATLEHSSIVAFIEWNWLGMIAGQLGGRDQSIANLGSLLDPSMTGVTIPGG
ncbi:MAG TPA: alkaline phosphatase family protein [Polyangia bacterium]|nr:alkaline phosphatase family protein [Polyangia bacterium]